MNRRKKKNKANPNLTRPSSVYDAFFVCAAETHRSADRNNREMVDTSRRENAFLSTLDPLAIL
jgi:hypothetical protein